MSKTDMNEKKVLVVGAGLSGCSAALAAHNDGHEVRIIESKTRDEMIGDGRSSFEALQNLTSRGDAVEFLSGIGLDIKTEHEYLGARIIGPSQKMIELRLKRKHGYFVRRKGRGSLDQQMLEKVEDAGIEVDFSTRYMTAVGKGRLSLKGNKVSETFKPWIIIGADGISSTVGRNIVSPLKKREIAIGTGLHFKGEHSFDPGVAECWLGSRLCPGEYAYVLPTETEVTVVTTMRPHLMQEGCKPSDYLIRFIALPRIKKKLKGTRLVNKVTGGVPVTSGGPLGLDNKLLVGEAARLTDPMLGFGMMNALISGWTAGTSISSPDPLTTYESRLSKEIMSDLKSRFKTRTRYIDPMDDRTIDNLVDTLCEVSEKIDPNRFFDGRTRKRAVLSAAAVLLKSGGTGRFMDLVVPLISANFSLR